MGHRSERRRPFPEQPLDTFSVGAMATLPAFRFSFLRPRNCRYFLSSSFEAPKPSPKSAAKALIVKYPRNPNLKQVIAQGMPYLEASTLDMLQNCGRESLFDEDRNGPSPRQLSEAQRILETVTEVVDLLVDTNKGGGALLCVQNFPIVILDVEVSPDCKQARVFWCLPLHLCDMSPDKEAVVLDRMQNTVMQGRGGRSIQSGVFSKLRFYYPPKLKFVPVPIQIAIESFLQDD